MNRLLVVGIIGLMLVGALVARLEGAGVATPQNQVATPQNQPTLQKQIATLQKQVATLQTQVATAQNDIAYEGAEIGIMQGVIPRCRVPAGACRPFNWTPPNPPKK
jgi:peptidoglycan hydrolase CwlO-like protein